MKDTFKLVASYVVATILVLGAVASAVPQQSKLPDRDQTTVSDLFERLGRCTSTLTDEQKYEEKLAAKIRDLEKTVAALQAANADLAKPPSEKK